MDSIDHVTSSEKTNGEGRIVCIKFNDPTNAQYWYEMVKGIHKDAPSSYTKDTKSIFLEETCPEG